MSFEIERGIPSIILQVPEGAPPPLLQYQQDLSIIRLFRTLHPLPGPAGAPIKMDYETFHHLSEQCVASMCQEQSKELLTFFSQSSNFSPEFFIHFVNKCRIPVTDVRWDQLFTLAQDHLKEISLYLFQHPEILIHCAQTNALPLVRRILEQLSANRFPTNEASLEAISRGSPIAPVNAEIILLSLEEYLEHSSLDRENPEVWKNILIPLCLLTPIGMSTLQKMTRTRPEFSDPIKQQKRIKEAAAFERAINTMSIQPFINLAKTTQDESVWRRILSFFRNNPRHVQALAKECTLPRTSEFWRVVDKITP